MTSVKTYNMSAKSNKNFDPELIYPVFRFMFWKCMQINEFFIYYNRYIYYLNNRFHLQCLALLIQKEKFSQKCALCLYLLALMLFQTCKVLLFWNVSAFSLTYSIISLLKQKMAKMS